MSRMQRHSITTQRRRHNENKKADLEAMKPDASAMSKEEAENIAEGTKEAKKKAAAEKKTASRKQQHTSQSTMHEVPGKMTWSSDNYACWNRGSILRCTGELAKEEADKTASIGGSFLSERPGNTIGCRRAALACIIH